MKKRIPDFDSFICEGQYSSVTLNISRQYINEFKDFLNSKKKSFKFLRYIEIYETCPIYITTKNDDSIDYAYDMDAGVEWDDDNGWTAMDINITISKEFFPMAFNDFIAEIKETIRHEIEHVSQENNPNKYIEIDKTKNERTYAEYILSTEELPAHLQGFLVKAKAKKQSMTKIINDFIDNREKYFGGNTKEMEEVKNVLIKSGQKMFPTAKWD